MTARARNVLEDCRTALRLLEDEKDLQRWRIHWVAALALIRAVGHVLGKVDGADPATAALAKAAYKKWKSDAPEHEIFREFIERERNFILKEYEFNLHPLQEVHVLVQAQVRRASDGHLGSVGDLLVGHPVPVVPLVAEHRPPLIALRLGDGRDRP